MLGVSRPVYAILLSSLMSYIRNATQLKNTDSITSPSQPAVYIAESAISSGTAGSSADGSENTAAVVGGLGLIAIAAASSIVLSLGKNQPVVQTADYSGPSLSYYISKFTPPPAAVEVSAPPLQTETSAQEVSEQPEVQADSQQETPRSDSNVS